MRKRLLKIFSKKFNYMSGNIKIKSDVELSNQQVKEICNIVTKTLQTAYYEKGFHIARRIVYRLGAPVCFAECCMRRKKVFIQISQYHHSRVFK